MTDLYNHLGTALASIRLMKKAILLVSILVLAACEATSPATPTPAPDASTPPAAGSGSPETCGAGQFDDFIGKPVHTMGSLTVPPGGLRDMPEGSTPSSLDNPERLNLVVDEQGNIVRAFCG